MSLYFHLYTIPVKELLKKRILNLIKIQIYLQQIYISNYEYTGIKKMNISIYPLVPALNKIHSCINMIRFKVCTCSNLHWICFYTIIYIQEHIHIFTDLSKSPTQKKPRQIYIFFLYANECDYQPKGMRHKKKKKE